MELLDFNPEPIMNPNARAVGLIYDWINQQDEVVLTQSSGSICRSFASGGNGYYNAVKNASSEEIKQYLLQQEQAFNMICSDVAKLVKKDYDVIYSRKVKKEIVKTVEVQKTRRVGLFKTENYVDYEDKVTTETVDEEFAYKGWFIENLSRKEVYVGYDGSDTLYIDYCLGADGKMYCVLSNGENDNTVLNCIFYSPEFLSRNFCNIYIAAVSGVIGVLDAIDADKDAPSRNVSMRLDNVYYSNFPIQIDSVDSYPYGFLGGVLERLIGLLDNEGREVFFQKYESLKKKYM